MRKNMKKAIVGVLTLGLLLGAVVYPNAYVKADEVTNPTDTTNQENVQPTPTPVPIPEGAIAVNETNFPDPGVYASARSADMMGTFDGYLTAEEAKKTEYMTILEDVDNMDKYLSIFTNLSSLTVYAGTKTTLKVSDTLTFISIHSDLSKVVNLTGGKKLTSVNYTADKKAKLDFKKAKGYSNIKSISVHGSKVSSVVLPNQAKLQSVDLSSTAVTKVDVSKCKKLTAFTCYYGKLKTLNISANKNLKDIGVGNNKLTKLDTSKNAKLECVVAYDNKIKSINTTKNKKLNRLELSENKIKKVDVSKNKKLTTLSVDNNKLKNLDVRKNTKLEILRFNNNSIKKLKIKKTNKIVALAVGDNKIKTFPYKKYKSLTSYDVGTTYALLKDIAFKENLSVTLKVSRKKTSNIKSYLPKLKSYTFENLWGESEYYTFSSDGKFKVTSKGKALEYTSSAGIKVSKGDKAMTLYVQY